MQNYLDLMQDIIDNGVLSGDRTGTSTYSVFGRTLRYNLKDGFPLVTTKKVHYKSILHELLWFIRGDTNIKYLTDNGVTIWNEWADESGVVQGHVCEPDAVNGLYLSGDEKFYITELSRPISNWRDSLIKVDGVLCD